MVEDIVADPIALGDALVLVEEPVDAEINAALAILFFRLGEGLEKARTIRSHSPVAVFRNAVPLIRDEGERMLVGAIKASQNFKERPAEGGMTRRIGGERRCKVGPTEVAGLAAQRAKMSGRRGCPGCHLPCRSGRYRDRPREWP